MFSKKLAILIGCSIGLLGTLSAQKQTSTVVRPAENVSDINTAKAKLPDVKLDEYSVGETDVLRINVWKEQAVSQTVVVRTDGSISITAINQVNAAGLTPMTIQQVIGEK